MKKPVPSSEIVIEPPSNTTLFIRAYSKDAMEWVETETPTFGNLHHPDDDIDCYWIIVSPGFKAKEVREYLLSYNGEADEDTAPIPESIFHQFVKQTAIANLWNAVWKMMKVWEADGHLFTDSEIDTFLCTGYSQLHHLGLDADAIRLEFEKILIEANDSFDMDGGDLGTIRDIYGFATKAALIRPLLNSGELAPLTVTKYTLLSSVDYESDDKYEGLFGTIDLAKAHVAEATTVGDNEWRLDEFGDWVLDTGWKNWEIRTVVVNL